MYKLHGLRSKVLNIPVRAGIFSYTLDNYQSSTAFGDNEQIVGIIARYNKSGNYKSNRGNPLIDLNTSKNGWLTLYDTNNRGLLIEHNLFMLSTEEGIKNSYGVLFPPSKINWSGSELKFHNSVNLVDGHTVEFTLLYISDCSEPYLPNILPNTHPFNACRKKTIYIKTNTATQDNFFSFSNKQFDACDTIVGVRFAEFDYTNKNGITGIKDEVGEGLGGLACSFLKLRVYNTDYQEYLPLTETKPIDRLGYDYFPLEPLKASAYDWIRSGVFCSDKKALANNVAYSFTFYYY